MENEGAIIAYFLSPEWLMVFSLIAYFLIRKPLHILFGTPNTKDLVNGLVIFIQLLVISIVLDSASRALGVNDTQSVNLAVQNIFSQGLWGAGNVIFSALAEEIFFRGILFSILGSIPTIFLFGLAHTGYGSAIELTGALAAGFILIYAREKHGSIFPGLVGHVLYNLVVVFVLIPP